VFNFKSVTLDFVGLIKSLINDRLKDVHTALPARVLSFDAATQTASVQTGIKRLFIDNAGENETIRPENLPVINNVPVIFPKGGGYSLTFPVAAGDECLLIFVERGLDTWHDTGKDSAPLGRRMHDLTDAVCYVGLSSMPAKIPVYSDSAVRLQSDDGNSHVEIEGSEITVTATSVKIDADDSTITGALRVDGGITTGGDVVSDLGISLNTHIHAHGLPNTSVPL